MYAQAPPVEANDPVEEYDENNEEDEEEDEEEVVEHYVSKEQEFDYKQFLGRFTVKSVCSAYANLLADYKANAAHTNHCIVKMFHRIAWECGQPAMLFHISVFRAFQAIHKDHKVKTAHQPHCDPGFLTPFNSLTPVC